MVYPLLFRPIVKKMIWGSERWDITCRPQEMGVIENGCHAGETFEAYTAKNPTAVLGTKFANNERFPLLVKIIDARDALSVQVHPNDDYVASESDSGKSEMWYVLDPPSDGHLIIGLKPGITRKMLADAYDNRTVEDCLNRLKVQSGDVVNIPAGLVHALTPGAVIAEVQQNSDITYRLYDYNRLDAHGQPRPLHVEDALAVSDFEGKISKSVVPPTGISSEEKGVNHLTLMISDKHFTIYKYALQASLTQFSNPETFTILTCVEGDAVVECVSMTVDLPYKRSVLLPAALGEYAISPKEEKAIVLKSEP